MLPLLLYKAGHILARSQAFKTNIEHIMEKRLANCLVFLTVAGKGKEIKMDQQLKWKRIITME